jgi:enoyl-CoA hydratase/carnithine racemase
MESPSTALQTHREDGVLEVTLDRPKANAIDLATSRAMGEVFAGFRDDVDLRVAILRTAGDKFFSAGWDLKASAAGDAVNGDYGVGGFGGLQELPDLNKPVIAAVHGLALGGGFELALSCDLIVADGTAVVGLPEVSVGVIPGGGGTQLLPRRVGAACAAELIFTARRVAAAEARELGLVDRLVADGEDRTEALELARRIVANSPVGLRAAKRALRVGYGLDLRAGLEVEDAAWRSVAFSGDRAEGVAAFNEKRTPNWPGE